MAGVLMYLANIIRFGNGKCIIVYLCSDRGGRECPDRKGNGLIGYDILGYLR
jgi:hypothetical protein